MITSRGCMFQCSYCDRSVFKKGFRYNSAEYIYEHMKYLREKFGVRHINVYDDLFTANRRIVELCEKLSVHPLGINFNCAVRVGYTDDGLLSLLKNAGCLMVSLGIESVPIRKCLKGINRAYRLMTCAIPSGGFKKRGYAPRDFS